MYKYRPQSPGSINFHVPGSQGFIKSVYGNCFLHEITPFMTVIERSVTAEKRLKKCQVKYFSSTKLINHFLIIFNLKLEMKQYYILYIRIKDMHIIVFAQINDLKVS